MTASVTDVSGDGANGVHVDFELTGGPGDNDIGSAGDTPTSPDLTCTTTGGGPGVAATCAVAYAELDNAGGTDALRAWIDADGTNSTVEADLGEGRDETSGSVADCAAGTTGPGDVTEPDETDCVSRAWTERTADPIHLSRETAT